MATDANRSVSAVNILALDTATEACSAAVLMGEDIIERYELAPRGHAGLILPMIEAVLAQAGIARAALDAIAFGCGPGAFTGVRIAAGVAQGIAFALDVPVVRVSTLAAIARQAMSEQSAERVLAAIDARMGEVYLGAYRRAQDNGVLLCGRERVLAPSSVSPYLRGEWVGAGSGWGVHGQVLARRSGITQWWPQTYPRARDVASLGALAYRWGERVTAEQAIPTYLRDNVARKAR